MSDASAGFALELQQLSKQFISGQRSINALKNISLTVNKGAVIGLVGPDGAGKTTLLRLVAGLLRPDTGTIRVFGYDCVDQLVDVHALIGYMPQRFGLYEDLSVLENLNLYANLHGVSRSVREQRFQELMSMTGLAAFTERLAGQLSGGMKQKLGLACTLLSQPALLLLDEPSVGVDPVSRRELWSIIEHQVKANDMTVLLSTAYLDEAERCNDVILLDEGHILAHNSPNFFKHNMQGQSYRVSCSQLSNRALQNKLNGQPGIIDAVIQGDKVRIISDKKDLATLPIFNNELATISIETTTPRLEDAFVALLREQHPIGFIQQIPLALNQLQLLVMKRLFRSKALTVGLVIFKPLKS